MDRIGFASFLVLIWIFGLIATASAADQAVGPLRYHERPLSRMTSRACAPSPVYIYFDRRVAYEVPDRTFYGAVGTRCNRGSVY